MTERVREGTNRSVQFGIAAAVQAVEESGVGLDPLRTSITVGVTGDSAPIAEAQAALDLKGPDAVPPKLTLRANQFFCAAKLAMRWGLHAPILTLEHACAAGLDAIGQGGRLIEMDDADVVIAVGTHTVLPDVFRHSAYGPPREGPPPDMELATDPTRQCMPFDVNRRNLIGAEGAGAVVLERPEHAKERGAHIYGYVKGYAALSDAHHPTAPNPSGEYEALVMERALERAGVASSDVDALIAHGTSTIKGDIAEMLAINSVFKDRPTPLPVTSTKGQLGHTAAASGIISVLAGIHCMETGRFVPTANTFDVEPEAEFEVITGSPAEINIDLMQLNAFGFGGHNSSMLLGRS